MKTTSKRAEYWAKHVEGYRSSGLTRAQYCAQNGIRVANLDYWRKKLNFSEKAAKQDKAGAWLPLRVVDEHVSGGGSQIDLRVGRITVEVRSGFDSKLLFEVLRAVGAIC
jgi:hypothetical protein